MDVGQNYSNKVKDIKEYYTDSARENKKQYDQQVEELKTNNEGRLEQKEKANLKLKNNMEADFVRAKEEMSERSNSTIEEQTERFRKELIGSQKNFENMSRKESLGMRNRLRDLSEEYQELRSDNSKRADDRIYNASRGNKFREDRDLRTSQRNIDDLSNSFDKSFSNQKIMNAEEISDLNYRHDKDTGETVKYNNDRRNLLTTQNADYIENLKLDQKNTMDQYKISNKSEVDNLKTQKKLDNIQLETEYGNIINDQSKNAEKTRKLTEVNLLRELQNTRDWADKEVARANIVNNSMKANAEINKNRSESLKGSKGTNQYRRVRSLNNQIEMDKVFFHERENITNDLHRKELTDLQAQANSRLRGTEFRLQDDKLDATDKLKTERSNLIAKYRSELYDKEVGSNERITTEQSRSKKILARERNRFEHLISKVNVKTSNVISKMQENYADEKTVMVEEARRELNNSKLNLKKDFSEITTVRDDNYQRSTVEQERRFQNMVDNYEKQLHNLSLKSREEINSIKDLAKDQHSAQISEFKTKLSFINSENSKKVVQMQNQFSRKISQVKHEDDVKLFETVNKYQADIKIMRKDAEKKNRLAVDRLKQQIKQQAAQNEMQKDSIIEQTNTRVAQMKLNNKKALTLADRRQRIERNT